MSTFKYLFLFIFLLLFTNLPAQYMASPRLSGVGLPFFHSGIFRTFTEDGQSRIIKIYIQMMNDDLTFVKENETFLSEIQFEIYVTNEQKDYVFNRTVNKEIRAEDFDETNSRAVKNTFEIDVPLQPGKYDAVVTVLDKNSNKQVNRKIHFNLDGMEGKDFLLSDILFFQKYETDSTGRITSFEPILINNFSENNKYIYFYFTSVVKDSSDTLNIQYAIRDPSRSLHQLNQYDQVDQAAFQEHFIRINRQHFDQSRYELELSGRYHGKTIKNQRLFSFYWTVSPESPKDLNLALKQMEYIIDADSIGWALKQPYKERMAYFERFWKRMDPNPETEKNELLEEYYNRVNYAVENFSTINIDGWETDRGRIFIKFGQPDDIERHPFEMNTLPYEIWRYYGLRKTFLFVDRTGFGDYYLHPEYLDEEFN